jgi:NAD+ kinase
MRVGMLLKRSKPEALDIAIELARLAHALGHEVYLVGTTVERAQLPALAEEELQGRIDLLVVLGGDGTLLHGAALVAGARVPILGINLGHLGFLTSCAPAGAERALEQALQGALPLEERMRLECRLTRAGGEQITKFACNDAVVNQGALARLMEVEAFLGGGRITTYRADGLIVSTPTGSTAYSLAAGGPILTPDLRAMVLTPICPHTLTNRPVVVPSASRVMIQLAAPADQAVFTVDGQWGTQMQLGDRIEVKEAETPLYVYRLAASYFDVLREKLHWGERDTSSE